MLLDKKVLDKEVPRLTLEKLLVRVDPGVMIGDAIRDALVLAVNTDFPVEFTFNGTLILVDPQEIRFGIGRDWEKARKSTEEE
jgi:hypothetical protein